jgi:nitrogen fixation protein FixH
MAELKRKSSRWPFIIVSVLAAQMVGILYLVNIARSDPGFAVEPDYYEKAVKWDSTAQARAAADRLGWTVEAVLGPITGVHNERELRVNLRDDSGNPVESAAVRLEFFPHARSGARQTATLAPLDPGVYATRVTAARPGLWEVRLDIIHAGVNTQFARTLEIPDAPAR